jgi:hypothetical protein
VMATTLEEELSLSCLDDVADYFSLVEEEAKYQDLEQEASQKSLLLSSNSYHKDCSMSS